MTSSSQLDISQYSFRDLVDVPAFLRMLESFFQATGIPNGVVDASGELLSMSSGENACALFHRAQPEAAERCRESNLAIMSNLREGHVAGGPCQNGLMDYATPVVIEGQQLATLFLGQVLHEPPDMEFFRAQAAQFGFDEKAYLESIKAIPVVDKAHVQNLMAVMVEMAQMLVASGLARLRQAALERDLSSNIERKIQLEEILDFSPVAISWIDGEGRIEHINRELTQLFGYTVDDLPDLETAYQQLFPDQHYRDAVVAPWRMAAVRARQNNTTPPELEADITCKNSAVRRAVVRVSSIGNNRMLSFTDITERKRAEQELKQALEFSEGIINALPDLLFELDLNGRYLNVWAQNPELLAAQKEALLDNTVYDVLLPDAAAITMSAIEEADRKGSSLGKVIRIQLPQGESWFELSVSRKPGPSQSDRRFIVLSRDVTKRRQAEQDLKQALEFTEGIINAIPDLLFEVDLNGKYLNVWTQDPALLAAQKEALLGHTIRDVLLPDAAEIAMSAIEEADRKGSSFGKIIRIQLPQGESWFELSVSRKPGPSQSDRRFIALSRDVTERKRLQDDLADSRNFLDRIINATIDAIFVKDRQHRWILVNDAFCQLVGGTREDFIGKSDFEIFPEQEARTFWEDEELVFTEGKEFSREEEFTNRDGEKRYVFTRKRIFNDVYGKPNLTGVVTDITERKTMELQLAARERELRSLMENIPDNIARFSPDARGVYFNRVLERVTDSPPVNLLGRTPMECFPDGRFAEYEQRILATAVSGGYAEMEMEVTMPDGTMEYHVIRFVAEHDEKGEVVSVLTIGTDITERKRTELQLATRERELRSLMENLPSNIVRYTPDARIIYMNPPMERLMGLPAADLLGKTSMEGFPDGRYAEVERKILATAASGGRSEMEVVVPIAGGEVEYHLLRFVAEHDDKDAVASVLVIGTDITERKRAELELAARERELRSLVENIPDNIARYTPDARHLYMSPVLERFNGKPREYFLGRTPMECFPDGRFAEYERRVLATAASGSYDEMEMVVPMADGTTQYHVIRFVAEHDEKGEVVSVLAIGTDITARWISEQRMQAHGAMLEKVARGADLSAILNAIVRQLESEDKTVRCSVLLLDAEGKHLLTAAAPSLPAFYTHAIHAIEIGEGVGSCGTVADLGEFTVVEDIQTHDHWKPYLKQAQEAELRACWSWPIFSSQGKVLGVFAVYHPEPKRPQAADLERIAFSANLAAIAIENRNTREALIQREREFRTLAENSPNNISRYDRDGRRVYTNPRLAASLPGPVDNLLGKRPSELPKQPYSDMFQDAITKTLQSGEETSFEMEVPVAGGNVEIHFISMVPERDASDAITGVLVTGLDITERKRLERELERQAHIDFLTGLANRRYFLEQAESELARTLRYGRELSILMLDIDRFKQVNDSYGHKVGDLVLQKFSQTCVAELRDVDIVGRMGGEEFAVLLPETGSEQSVQAAERMRAAIAAAQVVLSDAKPLHFTASFGVATLRGKDDNIDTLLNQADQALYRAKKEGRNRVCVFRDDISPGPADPG